MKGVKENRSEEARERGVNGIGISNVPPGWMSGVDLSGGRRGGTVELSHSLLLELSQKHHSEHFCINLAKLSAAPDLSPCSFELAGREDRSKSRIKPTRMCIPCAIVCQVVQILSIGIHDIDFPVPIPHGRKGNCLTVRRPHWTPVRRGIVC